MPVLAILAATWAMSHGARNWPFLTFTARPVSPAASSRSSAGSAAAAPTRRARCSIMVITSSITRPTAAASPPRVMMLKVSPRLSSSSTVTASVAGTTSMATKVTRRLRRKPSSTSAARPSPIRIASRTLPAESVTSVLWSYHVTRRTPAGRRDWNPARAVRTAAAMATVLASGCW